MISQVCGAGNCHYFCLLAEDRSQEMSQEIVNCCHDMLSIGDSDMVGEQLGESLMGTAQIVFFLMGAMTIVEVVDAHNGFEVITKHIRTSKLSSLMWLVAFVTFFLSAILDNLTTTIVMISLMRSVLGRHLSRQQRVGR